MEKIEDKELAKRLMRGFEEGVNSWMNEPPVDHLVLARSFDKPSPRQIVGNLIDCGFIRNPKELLSIEKSKNVIVQQKTQDIFPDWSLDDCNRFDQAKKREKADEPKVMTFIGDLINPNNDEESCSAVFIAAGGLLEGLLTSQGVIKMRRAMEEAERLQIPIVFLNSVTSADPSFNSEVGQISRQISETMALGLRLTVPKITVITGEAASAGAHAGWQIADTTLMLDRGALLTVISVDEALDLLRFIPEISNEVDKVFLKHLEELGLSEKSERIINLLKGRDSIEKVLNESKQNEQKAMLKMENEGTLKAIVDTTSEVDPHSDEKVMLIMPADKPRYIEGMLSRGADMITIHADDWQKRAENNISLTKIDLIEQTKQAMQKAQETKTKKNTEIFFRINASNFQEFWKVVDIEMILRELHSVGLTGIRFTEEASVEELQKLNLTMFKIEKDLGLDFGTFKICLSVETDNAIDQLSQTIQKGDVDKRVSTVVMGVRDYTKSKASEGVEDREWNHEIVIKAKKKFKEQVEELNEKGWNVGNFQAIASVHNDYGEIHREVNSAKELGADGILAVAPEQINHTRACYEEIFNLDGSLNEERLRNILERTNFFLKELIKGNNPEELIQYYRHQLYEIYHQYRIKLLRVGNAFPEDLRDIGIVDGLVSSENMIDLAKNLWENIKNLEQLSPADIRRLRLSKLAKLGSQTIKKAEKIDLETRRKKAIKRDVRSAQYWLDLLTNKNGFSEEILNDLEPDTASDILDRMGRRGNKSYKGQIQEAQSKTGTLSGIITGYASIGGKEVLLMIRDQDFINATAGASTGEIVRRACLDAVNKKRNGRDVQSVIYIDVSAGGRVQEGAQALLPSELAVAGLVEAELSGIKRINIGHTHILGSDGIGPFYCADEIVLVGNDTELGLAGRRIVEKNSPRGKKEFPPGFRSASFHKRVGNIKNALEAPEELKSYLSEVLNINN
ncbi:MAG: hypothetical protein AUJ41_04555 [Candidatus Pacebacteria bacterium CG1_02_43_31]|nr:MAG: hypothetical protein AUJ41_04555 [Candidatus Pacebacteria bacterium CG1_02_43_31]